MEFYTPSFTNEVVGAPTGSTLSSRIAISLDMAAKRYNGNYNGGVLSRMAIIVRGGLAAPPESQVRERKPGQGSTEKKTSKSKTTDGPKASVDKRMWEKARKSVSKVMNHRQGLVFLSRQTGSGDKWYRAVATILENKFGQDSELNNCHVAFKNAMECVDSSPEELVCHTVCGKFPLALVALAGSCEQEGQSLAALAIERNWGSVFSDNSRGDENDMITIPKMGECPIHGRVGGRKDVYKSQLFESYIDNVNE